MNTDTGAGFRITARLPSSFREQLEELVFFNPSQQRVHKGILSAIRDYGKPSIIESGGMLQLHLAGDRDVQSLYAVGEAQLEGQLLGLAVFTRTDTEHFVVIHLAVREDCSMKSAGVHGSIAIALVEELKRVLRQVKGAIFLRLLYSNQIHMDLPIQRAKVQAP